MCLLLILLTAGCAITQKMGVEYKPQLAEVKLQKEFDALPPPDGKKVTVAVYVFADKTGQRKPTTGIASLSMAVTQGAEVFLIKALQDVGKGMWFDVVERVNVDALTKERLIIRQMREAYEGKDAKPLMPLQFAGLIMEGGIIGYDSGSESGGAAYRFLGVGPQTQYSKDTVTVSLRAISVNTGKVLAAVTVTKIVYSTADSFAMLKFLNAGTQAFEAETGLTINEPGTLAVKATVEAAVVELIKEGERKGVWDYKKAEVPATVIPPKVNIVVPPKVELIEPEKKVAVVATADPKEISKNVNNPVAVVRGPPPELIGKTMYVNVAGVFLRKDPLETSTKQWWMGLNQEVVVNVVDNDWLFVKATDPERKGWVRKNLLSDTKQ